MRSSYCEVCGTELESSDNKIWVEDFDGYLCPECALEWEDWEM